MTKMQDKFLEGFLTYDATTRGVKVEVQAYFLEAESKPDEGEYFWAYRIHVTNLGNEPVQIINRFWEITDGNGKTEFVRGSGVVGEQPTINPEDMFAYTSGCPLKTPSGFMQGTFEVKTEEGRTFEVKIPTFSLDSPHQSLIIN